MEYNSVEGKGANRMVFLDLEYGERRLIAQPDGVQSISAYSYGADGKRIAFVGYSQEVLGNKITLTYRLYVCNADGSSRKVVFETKPGEAISDVDWR